MARHDHIVCKKCHGENNVGSRFCWYCGGPLRGRPTRSLAEAVAFDVVGRAAKWLVFLAVLAGVVYGAYWGLSQYVWPRVHKEAVVDLTVTSSTLAVTTSTTLQPRVDRQVAGGADRYSTAVAITKLAFPTGAQALVLVPGEDFSQSLAVEPLAAAYRAPVLLVPPEGLWPDLIAEIQRLAPTQVFLVGLPNSDQVGGQLTSSLNSPTITTLIGSDPYKTAALIADAIKSKTGSVSKVVIAPSDSFTDALSVAPLAAANGWPILLAPKQGEIPWTTSAEITKLGATSALVVGLKDLQLSVGQVETQAGDDAFETAALVVQYAVTHGSDFTHTAIVTGDNFPDALVAGSYLALDKGVLIFAVGGQPVPSLRSILDANLGDIRTLDFIALPGLARQIVADATTTTTATTETSETETTSTGPDSGSTESTDASTALTTPSTNNNTQPSSGGW